MKNSFRFMSLCVLLTLFSCGGNNNSEDSALSPQERQAVDYVKSHLERGVRFTDYSVVEEQLPVCLMEQQFQSFRNGVFKAGLDYQTNKTRNLEAGMEMAVTKIAGYQEEIQNAVNELEKTLAGKNALIVYGKVRTKATEEVEPQGLVVALDPETMQQIAWIPVTVPVQNNVGMIINAMNGTLFDYALTQDHDFKALASTQTDPVVKFILESRAV